jgi:hypothetical protein
MYEQYLRNLRLKLCLSNKVTRQAIYMRRNIEARPRDNCCSGKAISITYSECVFVALSYPACNVHAPRFIVIHGLSGSTVFFHSIS